MKEFFKKIGRAIVKFIVLLYCKIVYRIKIIGKENIPKEGALIFCANHRTYLDPPLILTTAGRHMRFLAKQELKKNPLFYVLGIIFEGIFVKRDSKDISAMKEALKTLKSGNCIGLFPEGTRNGLEKNNGQIKNGASYLALKTGAKVVPIGIVGPSKPFTKNVVIYGNVLDFSEYITGKKIEKETEDKVSEIIKDEILKLTDSVYSEKN